MVSHPLLEGIDGIALDNAGNIWATCNTRQAIVVVAGGSGTVHEVFRNPVNPATQLRNEGPLELPTSPYLLGDTFCAANLDAAARDNSPNSAGELNPATGPYRGKISCMDQHLMIPGMPLP